ncbi:uncharacterized protein MONBRDRAFT_25375 [Monosiga brevicollis MX1]|uniref:Protein kinase domain-containing protein n=1 Tax=Monosiga brevicollis TaxID=81824 RepID=A9UZ84_MONBE|nr:uncharacterized protein MONBRDRAFT_25375 [Monosiga brevicollis MX1]EDQ89321.1 predicted protein [Monosiga brevicollis MX1]|eukprot:XP_001745897.1 hypothetical protein [Monosiga brevicollis MX1]
MKCTWCAGTQTRGSGHLDPLSQHVERVCQLQAPLDPSDPLHVALTELCADWASPSPLASFEAPAPPPPVATPPPTPRQPLPESLWTNQGLTAQVGAQDPVALALDRASRSVHAGIKATPAPTQQCTWALVPWTQGTGALELDYGESDDQGGEPLNPDGTGPLQPATVLVIGPNWTADCNASAPWLALEQSGQSPWLILNADPDTFLAALVAFDLLDHLAHLDALYITVPSSAPSATNSSIHQLLAHTNLTTFGLRAQNGRLVLPDPNHHPALAALDLQSNTLTTLPPHALDAFSQLIVLDLAYNNLTNLPPNLFAHQTHLWLLDLTHNQLAFLPDGTFQNLSTLAALGLAHNRLLAPLPETLFQPLTNLLALRLAHNDLAALSPQALAGLSQLGILDLAANALTALHPMLLADQTQLQQLSLEKNELVALSGPIFASLSQLIALSLDSNGLTALDPALFRNLTNLQSVTLAHNVLTTLASDTFAAMPQLSALDLTGNLLTGLPADLWALNPALAQITLSDNRLTALADGIFAAQGQLYNLYLSDNALTALPDQCFRATSQLVTLYLHQNQLTALSVDTFAHTPELNILDLSTNLLSALPSGLWSNLAQLNSLDLSNNWLNTLALDSFAGLSSLGSLSLAWNQITTLPAHVFDHVPNVFSLVLQGNQLSTLPAGLFDKTPSIMSLSLQKNQLTALPAGLFKACTQMDTLFLMSNQLTTLPPGLLAPLTSLHDLDFNSNQLTTLAPDTFAGLTQLYRLQLTENRLSVLDPATLAPLTRLYKLSLAQNPLQQLNSSVLPKSPELLTLDLSDTLLTTLALDLRGYPLLQELHLARNDCPATYQVDVQVPASAPLTVLTLTGAAVTGLTWSDWPSLTLLAPGLLGSTLATPLLNLSALPHLTQLDISCWPHAATLALAFAPTPEAELRQLDVHAMPRLTALQIDGFHGTLESYNVSGNPVLARATMLNASVFDLSRTRLPLSPLLCARTGTALVSVASNQEDALPWANLLRQCIRAGTKVIDLSNNSITSLQAVTSVLGEHLYVGNTWADGCAATDSTGQIVCSLNDVPSVFLQNSPLQCALRPTSSQGVMPDTSQVVQSTDGFGGHRFFCECSPGYQAPNGTHCLPIPHHTPLVQRPWFVALMTLVAVGLLMLSTVGLHRWQARRMRRLHEAHELERLLLAETYHDEIAELKQAWRIQRSELELLKRIDGDSPGAFGEVWGARWQDLEVCVKILNASAAANFAAVQDFEKELDFLQRTRHPHLVRFFGAGEGDFGAQRQIPFLVLELVKQGSLRSVLRGSQPRDLSTEQRVQILADVASGLAYLHQLGHAHRDIKAGNVLVTEQYRAKVTDFGSVKLRERLVGVNASLTKPGSDVASDASLGSVGRDLLVENMEASLTQSGMAGTPLYMAVEVLATACNGGLPADVFSFGVLMWEALTSQTPDLLAQEYGGPDKYRGPLLTGLWRLLDAGKRLDPAAVTSARPDAPDLLITLMTSCWVAAGTTATKAKPSPPTGSSKAARKSATAQAHGQAQAQASPNKAPRLRLKRLTRPTRESKPSVRKPNVPTIITAEDAAPFANMLAHKSSRIRSSASQPLFVMDPRLADLIAAHCDVEGRHVYEQAAGAGLLTQAFLQHGAAFVTGCNSSSSRLNIDPDCFERLTNAFPKHLSVINAHLSVLGYHQTTPEAVKEHEDNVLAARQKDLPRTLFLFLPTHNGLGYITNVLYQLVAFDSPFSYRQSCKFYCLLNRKWAQTLVADPGQSRFTRITALTKTLCDVHELRVFPRQLFSPPLDVYKKDDTMHLLEIAPKASLPDSVSTPVGLARYDETLLKLFAPNQLPVRKLLEPYVDMDEIPSELEPLLEQRSNNLTTDELLQVAQFALANEL